MPISKRKNLDLPIHYVFTRYVATEYQILASLETGPKTAAELYTSVRISQATFSRLANSLIRRQRIRAFGKGRATKYARLRNVRNLNSSIPVQRVSAAGSCKVMGTLWTVAGGFFFEGESSHFSVGLPWFLQDMRPQGFLGRMFSGLHPELALPSRLQDWTDDDSLFSIAMCGEDVTGNIIAGEESFARFMKSRSHPSSLLDPASKISAYAIMADSAMHGSPPGSSPGGEQPKFSAILAGRANPIHVIVKFSPPRNSAAAIRWADLLVCEHLALNALRSHNIEAAETEIIVGPERTFLEVVRFDRTAKGRVGLASFGAIDDGYFGFRDNWINAGQRMMESDWLKKESFSSLAIAYMFGQLIGNTDMHFGNISILTDGPMPYALAPIYDCLPMLYAPVTDQIIPREFEISYPRSMDTISEWKIAHKIAKQFWRTVAKDKRVSHEFRSIALKNLEMLEKAEISP